jgi:hypothetical protein
VRLTWILSVLFLSCCATTDDYRSQPQPEIIQQQSEDTAESDTDKATVRLRQLRPRIVTLVARLGSTEYRVRQEAQAALREIGLPAVPALEEAANSPDAEVSHSAALLLESLKPSFKPITVSKSPQSVAQKSVEKMLKAAPVINGMPKARLLSVLKSLGTQTGFNFLVHPDLLSANPEMEIDGASPLPDVLENITKNLQSAWVARFGVLYLSKPETALELAGAQILTWESQESSKLFLLMREKTVRISLRKTNLAKALDFFTELIGVSPVFADGVSPDTEVSRFEVSDISARDALSLLLFSLNLKARLSEDKISISKGDYGKHSEDYRSQQSLLNLYRQAWKSLFSDSQ